MRVTRALARAAACFLALACARAEPPRIVEAGRMGKLALFSPREGHEGFVFLISDAGGWSSGLADTAREIARGGVAVAGIDLPSYLAGLAATRQDECHYTVAELEDWSHRLQRELGFERYRTPILVGVGAGATLAHVALAQSPAATLAGAIGAQEAPALATRVPLCAGAPSRPVQGGFAYMPAAELPGFWREAPTEARLADVVADALAEEARTERADLADLPLVEIPTVSPSSRFAVIYSGDGGWRDLDKQIGEYFAAHGTPTVGVDSLRYFWRAKTPDAAAADLARILRHYREAWGASEVLLVGYSFGAGILPAVVNRLPADLRGEVRQISLLGLEPRAPFEIAVSGWLGGVPSHAAPVLPELVQLDLSRVQCFFGEEEEQTLCRDPALARAEVVRTRGGHHFDGDYEALARRILDRAERRSSGDPARVTSRPSP